MNELQEYMENNPKEKLLIGLTVLNQYYVRPISWCGMWKDDKLFSGNCLAYFDTKEELDNALLELNYEID